jgi:diguanylate cyclase (GGDEF)-like protein
MNRLKAYLFESIKKIYIRVPDEIKSDYKRELLEDNFFRLSIVSVFMFIIEIILYFLQEYLFRTGFIMLVFLLCCLVLIPLIFYVRKHAATVSHVFAHFIMLAYAITALLFGASLALFVLREADVTHVYLMIALGVALFFYIRPLPLGVLLFTVYVAFALALPYFGASDNTLITMRINAFIFNLFAWALGQVSLRSRTLVFVSRRQLHEQNRKLEDLAQRDTMTGLLNHAVSFARLEDEIKRAKAMGYPLSLIIADIDDFKQVNDNHGHLAGDLVIMNIADAIRGAVKDSGIVGRYGGEEFIVILPRIDIDAARTLSANIQGAIAQACTEIPVTLSGGISQYTGETLNEFIRLTDEKLYKAKRRGKNKFRAD